VGDSAGVIPSNPIPPPTSQPAPAATESASAADKNPANPPVRGAQLLSANALWLQAGLTFAPEYREIAGKRHSAMLAQADFLANAQQARRMINAWVAGQTGQMVKELLSSDMVDSTTRLLLTNAVCLRAAWIRPFDVANTGDQPFRVSDTLQVPVPMMNQVGVFRSLEADGLQIVELPYDGGAFSMVIIVPRLGALRGLESQLSELALTSYLKGLTPTKLDLSVPRFKLGSKEDLRDLLKALGMPLAFTNRADFTGLCHTDRGLKVSALVHESTVEVTEVGTVAASATGASLIEKGFEIGVRRFKADRPFLFLIRDNRGGTIVFLGRYSGPSH
jgi:serpin B